VVIITVHCKYLREIVNCFLATAIMYGNSCGLYTSFLRVFGPGDQLDFSNWIFLSLEEHSSKDINNAAGSKTKLK